eukprot:894805_1
MGSYFTTKKTGEQSIDATIQTIARHQPPTVSTKTQMYYIIVYWLKRNQIIEFANCLIDLIINVYAFQEIFSFEHMIRLKFPIAKSLLLLRKYNHEFDYVFNVMLIGNAGVGKSSLLKQFVDHSFSSDYISTIGIDFKSKVVETEITRIKLKLWEAAGGERFQEIFAKTYYRNLHGILLVYQHNPTDTWSFECIKQWNERILQQTPYVPRILVGNKCDVNDSNAISKQAVQDLCKELMICASIQTSAKTGQNVDNVFKIAVDIIDFFILNFNITQNTKNDFF